VPDHKPLILLADDEVDVALVAQTRLEVSGYEVVTAADGEEALRLFESVRPDLVLLDILMPRLDGFQVCAAIRSGAVRSDVPIIIFSASSSHSLSLEKKCLEMGADACIRKPYPAEELLAHIERLLAGRCQPVNAA
jgi:CheY-like chemotaxis protein